MSGIMNSFNNCSGSRENTSHRPPSSRPPSLGGDGGRNSSLTDGTDGSSFMSSFLEGGDQSVRNSGEETVDKDIWGNRIVLTALVEIAFSEVPHPKLPLEVVQGLQKFLLSINTAAAACNPFVEPDKLGNVTFDGEHNLSMSFSRNGRKGGDIPSVELPGELVEGMTAECRVVLRSLVSAFIRKQVGKIREFWKPILEINGHKVPDLPDGSSITHRKSVCPSSDSAQAKKLFDLILKQAKIIKTQSEGVDAEVEELIKLRNEELRKHENDVTSFKDLTMEVLKEQKEIDNIEFGKAYMDYLNLEDERITQQIHLEKLKLEGEERGDEHEQQERRDLYNQAKKKLDEMLAEAEEMEDRLHKYQSLSPEYLELLEKYRSLEEDIKLKEWVLEQLANAPQDESSLMDDD